MGLHENWRRATPWLVVAAALLHAGVFMGCAVAKYGSFSFTDIDLAILNQTAWNMIHGDLVSAGQGHATIFNGGHVFLILLVLAPLYALFQSPVTLLCMQSLALASGAWPVYLIGRRLLTPTAGAFLALSYLVYPAMNYVDLYEFHPIAFSTPLLLFMFQAYLTRRRAWFFATMVLALMCREDIAIPVFAFGLFAAILALRAPRGERAAQLAWCLPPLIVSVLWFLICLGYIQPRFRPPAPAGEAESLGMLGFYSWLGNSPGEILRNALLQPGRLIKAVLIPAKLVYIRDLLIPLGFTSLLSPSAFVMVLVSLSEGLLSQRFTHYSIVYQYSSIITPWVFVSAAYGLRNLTKLWRLTHYRSLIASLVLLGSLASAALIGPLPSLPARARTWQVTTQDLARERLLARVPEHAPVVCTFRYGPRLSNRPRLYHFYHVYAQARSPNFAAAARAAQQQCDWALVDFDDPITFNDFYSPEGDAAIHAFLSDGQWELVESVDATALFRRGKQANMGLVKQIGPEAIPHPLNVPLSPVLNLRGYDLTLTNALGMAMLDTRVYLELSEAIPVDLILRVQIIDPRTNDIVIDAPFWAPYRIYPTSRWVPGAVMLQRARSPVPTTLASGTYDVAILLMIRMNLTDYSGRTCYRSAGMLTIP